MFEPEQLLEQCARLVATSPHVDVEERAIAEVASGVDAAALVLPGWSGPKMEVPEDDVPAWLMAYNAVNFCYWPEAGEKRWWTVVDGAAVGDDDEALGIMAAFAHALREGVPLGDGAFLAELDVATLEDLLAPAPGAGRLPCMEDRLDGLQELGRAWIRVGGARALLEAAGGSAVAFADRLAAECPRFNDVRVWHGEHLRFLKRAQLCAAMLHGRLGGSPFRDVHRLTAFADYRLPQILRFLEILRPSRALHERLEDRERIAVGSEEEVALRAATVHAAERLRQAWDTDALRVDYWLWSTAVTRDWEMPAFHRTRTTDY